MERTNDMNDNTESPDTVAAAVPSARPWAYWQSDDKSLKTVVDAQGKWVAELSNSMHMDPIIDANGRHIVTCVNEHDALVTANRALV